MTLRLERKYNRRFQTKGPSRRDFAIGVASFQLERKEESNKLLRWTLVVAVVLHVGLFLINFPTWQRPLTQVRTDQKVFVLQQVRFKPPKPVQQKAAPPKRKARKVPMPDPTPDLPEPILREEVEAPDIVVAADLTDFTAIPDAPAAPGVPGLRALTSDLIPPQKIYAPQPPYTEEARQARVQGVVIMQAIIDTLGKVTNVRVLKGLPSGLADSAVATVQRWEFEPAMTRAGEPVPVRYNFTVNFTLQ